MVKDSLGDRMKRYEVAARSSLPPRMPAILRVDGKAFHSYTRGLRRPFDPIFMRAMDDVAKRLCEEIQGAQLAYVQSDEVSVLVHNYKRHATTAWFDNQVQKMVSVAAAVATSTMVMKSMEVFGRFKECAFDARVFVLPESEVCNYFIWRMQDSSRNSIQMLARSLYSHKECHNKNTSELQEMTFQKGENWNDLPIGQRRGRVVKRLGEPYTLKLPNGVKMVGRGLVESWQVDAEPPIFTADRGYIEQHLAIEDEE
jgi:tRNA(His) guanylyltransferase